MLFVSNIRKTNPSYWRTYSCSTLNYLVASYLLCWPSCLQPGGTYVAPSVISISVLSIISAPSAIQVLNPILCAPILAFVFVAMSSNGDDVDERLFIEKTRTSITRYSIPGYLMLLLNNLYR